MQRRRDELWTWLLPDGAGRDEPPGWPRHGGKWILFDSLARIEMLADQLAPYIDGGEIHGAKYWSADPSAINVYALDRERRQVATILRQLGATRYKVWEYDYAWDKNLRNPCTFLFSQGSKLRTIVRSYGVGGSLELARGFLSRK